MSELDAPVAAELSLYRKARRRAGRVKRWVKRKLHERSVGKQYRAWLAAGNGAVAGSVDNPVPVAVIVPVFNPPLEYLEQCLGSVLTQTAKNWQLVISDDGSDAESVGLWLAAFAERHRHDPRITVIRGENAGISAACNRALDLVTTSHFGWLDHDDVLDPRALAMMSEAVAASDPDVVYSDEDKIIASGRNADLYCKPEYSPELLLTQMYLCHFTVFRTALVNRHGGFRSSMDGAQDFDLALRISPELQRVVHIPLPLYHWRAWANSTALTIEAKPWAQQAAARAQQEHLDRTFGGGSVVSSAVPGLNEVHPRIDAGTVVSVIIPTIGTRNSVGRRLVDDAVESLRKQETQARLEIVVVTTGVIDPVPGADKQIVYSTDAFNFAEAINLGRANASGEYLLLLNDDTTVAEPNPVSRMIEIGQLDGVGIVGAKLSYPDGRLQHVGIVLLPSGPTHPWIGKKGKDFGYFGSTLTPRNYSAVTAAAMLVRASAFDAVGGFDAAFARDFNDVDFCLRVRDLGLRVAWTPYAHFTHHEGASIVRRLPDAREAQLFADRWARRYAVDPYYSAALDPRLDRIYEEL